MYAQEGPGLPISFPEQRARIYQAIGANGLQAAPNAEVTPERARAAEQPERTEQCGNEDKAEK